jgi:hypothetical protein
MKVFDRIRRVFNPGRPYNPDSPCERDFLRATLLSAARKEERLLSIILVKPHRYWP